MSKKAIPLFGKEIPPASDDASEFAESIINTVREPLIVLDQDLKVVSASRSFYEIFKVNPGETIGQFIYDLGNKQWDIPKLRELLETILPQKMTFDDYEVEHDFTTIGKRIMLLNARQIQRVLGKERIILLAIEDITERKEIEGGLEKTRKELAVIKKSADEAREFAESLINTIREPLIALDQDLRVVAVSRSFYEVFKVNPKETVGQLIYDLGNKQWDIPGLRELLETILPQKTTFDDYEVEHDFATIGMRTMLLNARQIQRGLGKERIILLAIEDITESKHLENDLQRYNERLKQKSRDLEQIIYVTSHDLRSPLVNVQGFSKELARSVGELIDATKSDDISSKTMRKIGPILEKDIPESIGFIQSGIIQMDMQLSALLKISRLGRSVTNAEKLDMNGIVAGIVKSFEYVVKEKGAQIRVDELPPCMADAAQSNQIFLNLIGNAIKYLDAKRPGIIAINGRKQGNFVVYCIEDNGIGIARECQEKIFEIFYRIEQVKHSGEGLGLTIVRQCAEKQDGTVWVESETGKGSRFYVKLPAAAN